MVFFLIGGTNKNSTLVRCYKNLATYSKDRFFFLDQLLNSVKCKGLQELYIKPKAL